MCDVCLRYECSSRCPEYRRKPNVCGVCYKVCEECSAEYPEDEIHYINGRAFCEECILNMSVEEILGISEIDSVDFFIAALEGKLRVCG